MSLSIPLDGLGAQDSETSRELAFRESPLDDVMVRALEKPSGIAVEHKTKREAEARRFAFYRRINLLRKHGVTAFDRLVFTIHGTDLLIKPMAELKLKEL